MAKEIYNINEVAINNAVMTIASVLNKEQLNTPFLYSVLLNPDSNMSRYFKLYLDTNKVPAASVQAWGNNYQVNARGKGEVLMGSVNKTGVSYLLGEEALYDIRNLDTTAEIEKAILGLIYDDAKNGAFSVQQRMEAILLQTLSSAKTEFTADNNADGLVKSFDYEVPDAQKSAVTAKWSTLTAKGLDDIREWTEYMTDTMYVVPAYILMNSTSITNLLNQTATKAEIYANTITTSKSVLTSTRVSLTDLNLYLAHYDLPQIIKVVDNIRYLNAKGEIDETKRAWGTGKVTFIPAGKLGRLQYMPPLAEIGSSDYIRTQSGIFTVKQKMNSESDSSEMKTTVDIAGYPVIDRIHDMVFLNVESTTTY